MERPANAHRCARESRGARETIARRPEINQGARLVFQTTAHHALRTIGHSARPPARAPHGPKISGAGKKADHGAETNPAAPARRVFQTITRRGPRPIVRRERQAIVHLRGLAIIGVRRQPARGAETNPAAPAHRVFQTTVRLGLRSIVRRERRAIVHLRGQTIIGAKRKPNPGAAANLAARRRVRAPRGPNTIGASRRTVRGAAEINLEAARLDLRIVRSHRAIESQAHRGRDRIARIVLRDMMARGVRDERRSCP